jgi:MYXO-CTERM domain-containing protein
VTFAARWAAAAVVPTLGLLLCLPASAKQIVESFTSPATVTNGALLGQCDQLQAVLSGNGAITVAGNGHATLTTPVEVDAAMLRSAAPLPSGGYTVSVEVTKISYTQYTIENGVTLLTIANTVPQAASEGWWSNYRMLGVEVDTMPGSTNKYPIYVNYWDSANMYTWDGTQWGVGDPAWQPVLTFDPVKTYTVEVEKAQNLYTIRVRSGSTVLTQATVPVSSVRPATQEHLVVGDRLTNYFKGSMQINAIAMPAPPGCGALKDAGPPDTLVPDAEVLPDASPPDASTSLDKSTPPEAGVDSTVADLEPSDGTTGGDGSAPAGDGNATSWDLYTPDMGGASGNASDCDCSLGSPASAEGPPLITLLLLLLALRRRR